jgi:hypothetical protein
MFKSPLFSVVYRDPFLPHDKKMAISKPYATSIIPSLRPKRDKQFLRGASDHQSFDFASHWKYNGVMSGGLIPTLEWLLPSGYYCLLK